MVEPVKVCHGVKGIGQSSYNAFRQELLAPDPCSGPMWSSSDYFALFFFFLLKTVFGIYYVRMLSSYFQLTPHIPHGVLRAV